MRKLLAFLLQVAITDVIVFGAIFSAWWLPQVIERHCPDLNDTVKQENSNG